MQRLFRLSLLLAIFGIFSLGELAAQTQVYLAGRVAPGEVRVLVNNKDSLYTINREWVIGGTLIIEPGTDVYFFPNGKIIDSTGGRIIADGLANASYNKYPDNINPIATGSKFYSFADPGYFLYESATARTIDVTTVRDITVNASKYNYVYNVVIDTLERKIYDLVAPENTNYPVLPVAPNKNVMPYPNDNHKFIVPFEMALIYVNSRMIGNAYQHDNNLNLKSWMRIGDKSVNSVNRQIRFIGQTDNNYSREWGHIIVLPGARAAFFRNVAFEGFRKDSTTDKDTNLYKTASLPDLTSGQLSSLNNTMMKLLNGSGGALTTFSSRTWLINCTFSSNLARYKGGALQILESPTGFPTASNFSLNNIGFYDPNKNPMITEKTGEPSAINASIPAIDLLDETSAEPCFCGGETTGVNSTVMVGMCDYWRQAYDDARVSVLLGRMRNLKFEDNLLQLANVDTTYINGKKVVYDVLDKPAYFPTDNGNYTYGGAIYISGKAVTTEIPKEIEIGFGVNDKILIGGVVTDFPYKDYFEAHGNQANNYQSSEASVGSRGGAIYCGKYTSLIIAGKFEFNETNSPFLEDALHGANAGLYSMGGAIFMENTLGRLQVRGGANRDQFPISYTSGTTFTIDNNYENATIFYKNKSAAGGAIFVDGNTDPRESPIIGGSDNYLRTRDYGFNVIFDQNDAVAWGGAIFAKRNLSINGAGGVDNGSLIGYGGKYPIKFTDNTSGYAGGAIDIRIPNAQPPLPAIQRAVEIARSVFQENSVGYTIDDMNRNQVRGGGAIYTLHADLSAVKGVEFTANIVKNGNGGAIAIINPLTSSKRFFLTDLDQVNKNESRIVDTYTSYNYPFIYDTLKSTIAPNEYMLTRFYDNETVADGDVQTNPNFGNGTGTTQVGVGTAVTTNNIKGVSFITDSIGFAIGQFGTLIRFTSGGSKWSYVSLPYSQTINSIWFYTAKYGVIVCNEGLIMRTADTGKSWTVIQTPYQAYNLNKVRFNGTSLVGYAVGTAGTALKTVDGGLTWNVLTTNVTVNLTAISLVGSSVFVSGDRGTVIKSTDGGATWVSQVTNNLTSLNGIYFTDNSNGVAVGDNGTILKTTNGGDQWDVRTSGKTSNLNTIWFTGLKTAYVVGDYGVILKTIDAGDNWTNIVSGTTYSLADICFPNNNYGYAVGEYGTMIRSMDAGATWKTMFPTDQRYVDVVRYHPEVGLPENGVALGGGIYILDSIAANKENRIDTIGFNRVRFEGNKAFSGAAVYSDNYDLKLIFNRSLITANEATSMVGMDQNAITGPASKDKNQNIIANKASSDLVGAIIYGELQGPIPSYTYPEAANSIYGNKARFLIRLPDGPNSKGILAGNTDFGGIDTLRGNFWGRTEANVNLSLDNVKYIVITDDNGTSKTVAVGSAIQETFYCDINYMHNTDLQSTYFKNVDFNKTYLNFVYNSTDVLEQGPFESIWRYSYTPIVLKNATNDENTADVKSIPDKILMSAYVYDLSDKGTDIKTADYTKRRMSPIEDFSVGIPAVLKRFTYTNNGATTQKYVKRWVRDPFVADSVDDKGNYAFPYIHALQTEYQPDNNGVYYHPLGYPLFLEAQANYNGQSSVSNNDVRALNQTVFFVINETTGDFIRVNLNQVSEYAPSNEKFRGRVEFIPDSTNRNSNTTIRRTIEGLYNLGKDQLLLDSLRQHPENEDMATLQGRKYSAMYTEFANMPNLFSNTPSMPASNNGYATFFAGERYHALPVAVGDVINVISRSVLWKHGVNEAIDQGLSFTITKSTDVPVWTGDIVHLAKDTVIDIVPSQYPWKNKLGIPDTIKHTELLNKIFVTEDRNYPVEDGFYSAPNDPNIGADSKGRDSILSATAIDSNLFYDPRAFFAPEKYAYLNYAWWVDGNTGLSRWLMADNVYANDQQFADYLNPKDGAQGYLMFRGKPINPYIVPGGEDVLVYVQNYSPSDRTQEALKEVETSDKEVSKWNYIFCPYLNAPVYDLGENSLRARYLQQDTIYMGSNFTTAYNFRIFVVDSVPQFLETAQTVNRRVGRNEMDSVLYVQYNPTNYISYVPNSISCDPLADGRIKANLSGLASDGTRKLRFQIDLNTDDEAEDNSPTATGWDFRYGRTSYGFRNIAISSNDNTDSANFDSSRVIDQYWDTTMQLVQIKPDWMNNKYIMKYGSDDTQDQFLADFTTYGELNVRVPYADAMVLLTNDKNSNKLKDVNGLNTDTVFTVIVNDGHGGQNSKNFRVFINVAPQILDTILPNAKEDVDYNYANDANHTGQNLIDSTKMIKVYDPNLGQTHTYKLIYSDYPDNSIPRDPCYPEAGSWDVSKLKVTPNWLYINAQSGLLYGKPGTKDAPRTEQVVVLVTDEDGLNDLKVLNLIVEPTNHAPQIALLPSINCVDEGSAYLDTIYIVDKDLYRGGVKPGDVVEHLTITVTDPPGVVAEPNTLSGTKTNDTVAIAIKANAFTATPGPDGKVAITVTITDDAGASKKDVYYVMYSSKMSYSRAVTVENALGAKQWMVFGLADPQNCSSGDATDGKAEGKLDQNFCEYELPPIPQTDIFDARWWIPKTQGILRDVMPSNLTSPQFKCVIQPGGVNGNTSIAYPYTIKVFPYAPNYNGLQTGLADTSKLIICDLDTKGNYYHYNIDNGIGTGVSTVKASYSKDTLTVTISGPDLSGFLITYMENGVNDNTSAMTESKIISISPNPVSSLATITYNVSNVDKPKFEIYDALGNIVAQINSDQQITGQNKIEWNCKNNNGFDVPSGSYTCRMSVGSVVSSYQFIIIK